MKINIILLLLLMPVAAQAVETISLTQTHCQFIEAEAEEHHFSADSADQCKAINAKTSEQRLKTAQPLHLKAGDYIFRVKNRDVSYELGFWLRGAGLSRWRLPDVSGGGIATGSTHDYAISLEPGEYRYSCPLNPTPDYVLIVE
jgi:hypothetical protein